MFWEHVCGVADGSHDSTALSHWEETPHVCFHTLPTPGRGVNAATQAPKINTATILYCGLSVKPMFLRSIVDCTLYHLILPRNSSSLSASGCMGIEPPRPWSNNPAHNQHTTEGGKSRAQWGLHIYSHPYSAFTVRTMIRFSTVNFNRQVSLELLWTVLAIYHEYWPKSCVPNHSCSHCHLYWLQLSEERQLLCESVVSGLTTNCVPAQPLTSITPAPISDTSQLHTTSWNYLTSGWITKV